MQFNFYWLLFLFYVCFFCFDYIRHVILSVDQIVNERNYFESSMLFAGLEEIDNSVKENEILKCKKELVFEKFFIQEVLDSFLCLKIVWLRFFFKVSSLTIISLKFLYIPTSDFRVRPAHFNDKSISDPWTKF